MVGVRENARLTSWIAELSLVLNNSRVVLALFIGRTAFATLRNSTGNFPWRRSSFWKISLWKLSYLRLNVLGGESGLYGYPDAVAELYDSKYPFGGVTIHDWNQLDRDLWAALVHLSSGEAGQKVDNSGQGEGLVAYIRSWSWYNSNYRERKYESAGSLT